jgi:ureidoglycolate dehydrogenase (NAD+)
MATSIAAMGKINHARQSGQPIPPGWALTKAGVPTTDSATASVVLPLGGPKGSGLSLMFEILTSVLGANAIVLDEVGPKGDKLNKQNAMIVALDIAAFRAEPGFGADVDALADLMKSLPRQEGVDEILLPGERGDRIAAARRQGGIPVPPRLWDELAGIATRLGVPLPEVRA